MQDGILAQAGRYRIWSYDALDRLISQGIQGTNGQNYDEVRNYYDNYSFVSNYSSLIPSSVSNVVPASNLYGKGQMTGCWQRASNGEGMLSILGYDEMGFVAKKSEIGLGRQMSISDYTNNTLGEVTQENFRKYKPATNGTMECIASGTIQNNYNYLHTNLLTSSVISITDKNGSMRTDTIQNLTYDNFGHVTTNDRGGTVADMTYGYDLMHGWLKSIKSGGKFDQKLYRETEGSTPCYNGNISAMTWRTANDYVRRFDYEYNEMNWLSQATFSYYSIGNPNSPSPTLSLIPYVGIDHEDYTSEYSYDKNGNLTAVYRQGLVGDLYDEDEYCVYDTMDDYNVEYYGNQRRSVNGSGQGTPSYYGSSSFVDGVEDGDDEYAYNANGAMTMDLNKGITNISYDLLNNIRQVTFSGNRNIVYTYAADGTRLRAVHSRKVGNTWLKDSTDYCGSLILQNGAPSMYQFAGGYISFSNSALSGCHYYIQDYLGNNRMVVNKTGAVEQTTHYYPYGGVIGGIDLNPGFQKYKFGGKELDRSYGLDWYDVQARQYDPVVPSWHTIDPLAEKYYHITPYSYCAGNPVNRFDSDGMETSPIYDEKGKFLGTDDEGLTGNPIAMNETNFKQGMSHSDAINKSISFSEMSDESFGVMMGHYSDLPNRPDYDGYLTIKEANDWYRTGNGAPLFTDLSKIDLSGVKSLGESYVGQEKTINLLTTGSKSINDGLVYGNITLKRYPNHYVRAYADTYDFDMKSWVNPLNWIRNAETIIGSYHAGKGTAYKINIYGSKQLEPLFPWIK